MLAEPQQKQYKYSKSDEADQKIAVGLATAQILSEQGAQVVAKALSSNNPPKMLAVFLAQLIEMIQTHSASTDIPMSPVVWLAQGGAVDELDEIFEVIANKAGLEFDEGMMPAIKQELAKILQQRGQQLQQQGGQQQDQAQAPQQGIASPMGGMQ